MSDTPTNTYAHGPGGLLSQPGLGGPSTGSGQRKRARRLAQRVRTKALSPRATIERLWASGVKPTDIEGIWYSPSDDAWFVDVGDWAEDGTSDKITAVMGANTEIADEYHPPAGSKFTVRLKAWSAAARAAALATRRRNAAMRGQTSDPARPAHAGQSEIAHIAKPAKGGAKKPKKVAQTTEQKRAARLSAREQARSDTLSKMNIAPDGQQALSALRNGEQPDPEAVARGGFVAAGLVTQAADGSYHMTPAGRATLSAADAGDAGRAGDTISSARDRATAATARQERIAARRAGKQPAAASGGSSSAIRGGVQGLIGQSRAAHKAAAFAVFKDSAGAHRWVMISSNAFRDRDNEIVSTKALHADVARADGDGQYGPLRWWHVGIPFGPGLDLGDCDFNAMVGKMLIESGTFRDPQFATAIASKAHALQGSIGFTHPASEPDRDGVFWHIHRFERSLVPRGKAANPFTMLYVKEIPMDETKIKQLAEMLNIPIEQVQSLVASTQIKEQKLEAAGLAFKADMAAVTEDALPPAPDAEDIADGGVDEATEGDTGDDNMLTDAECSHIADMVVAKIAPMLDIEKKIAGHAADIKATMGGMFGQQSAQKDAKDAELREQIAQLQTRLKELEGDQPKGGGYRASLDTATVTTKPNAEPAADPLNDFIGNFVLGGNQPRQ